MDRDAKRREIQHLLAQVSRLENELFDDDAHVSAGRPAWAPEGYYTAYHLMAGFVLGGVGAIASLLFNVVGSSIVGRHPMDIIRVYLTFPLGERALSVNNGILLGIGSFLYLATGALYGMAIHYVMTRYYRTAPLEKRFAVISGLSLLLWVVNFYLILSWLQPALFGGNWITTQIPWYVGAATHLVFGWSMLVVSQWGDFEARHQTPAIAG